MLFYFVLFVVYRFLLSFFVDLLYVMRALSVDVGRYVSISVPMIVCTYTCRWVCIIVRHSLPLRFRFLSPCASFVILFIFSIIVGVGSIFIFVQVLLYREGYHWQEGNKCIRKIWLQTNIPTKRMQQQDEE